MAQQRFEEIRQARLAKRRNLLEQKEQPYPAEARRTHTTAQFVQKIDKLARATTPVILVGRVMSLRAHGGITFLDLSDTSGIAQLQIVKTEVAAEIYKRLGNVDTGDFMQAAGTATYSKRGVPTLSVSEFHLLAKSIRPMPAQWYGLKDHEKRYRLREVDIFQNPEARKALILRAEVINWLRSYFTKQGYLEVETPILESIPGGATARPFETHHNSLDIPLYLRISSELALKKLLVSGFEKVFDIGKRFRNEGIDRQHNPEFTMLESQWAYADYEDLMIFTEDILSELCQELLGTTDIKWQEHILSFAKPFKRERFIDLVNKKLDLDILTEKNPKTYIKIYEKEGLELPSAPNLTQLIDELYKKLVRPKIIQPTIVYDYPVAMAPLAKPNISDPRVAEQFQLVAVGAELNTCYTEQNDPIKQREMLEEQAQDRQAGDNEAHRLDETYLRAMEYGMPPNAGWSLGIDRFVMLLTNSASLRDTIAFPLLKPE